MADVPDFPGMPNGPSPALETFIEALLQRALGEPSAAVIGGDEVVFKAEDPSSAFDSLTEQMPELTDVDEAVNAILAQYKLLIEAECKAAVMVYMDVYHIGRDKGIDLDTIDKIVEATFQLHGTVALTRPKIYTLRDELASVPGFDAERANDLMTSWVRLSETNPPEDIVMSALVDHLKADERSNIARLTSEYARGLARTAFQALHP